MEAKNVDFIEGASRRVVTKDKKGLGQRKSDRYIEVGSQVPNYSYIEGISSSVE